MNWEDVKELDFEDPGGWPPVAKGVAAAAVVVIIMVAAYFLKFKDEWQIIKTKEVQEIALKSEFEEKQQKAVNLAAYDAQLIQLEEILRSLLRQLPSRTEMANLLQDVSQTAIATGIRVDKFQPQPEVIKDFYAEKPINIKMVGDYHQFGEFVSAVASLARVVILTMHDISLKPVVEGQSQLSLEGIVKTYRYLDEEEQAQQQPGGVGPMRLAACQARLLLLAVLLGALSACGRDMSDLQRYIADVQSRPGEPIPPLPSIETQPSFEYHAYELRDPFSGGPVEAAGRVIGGGTAITGDGPAPNLNRRREVLEGFELDSLEMVGTFAIEDQYYGLIEDPDGLIHRVREDNYLGRNHGRVLAVHDDRIELVELVPNGADAWAERRAEIALVEQ